MIDNEDCVQLSKYCRGVCVVLEAAIQGTSVEDLDESVRMALGDLERCAN